MKTTLLSVVLFLGLSSAVCAQEVESREVRRLDVGTQEPPALTNSLARVGWQTVKGADGIPSLEVVWSFGPDDLTGVLTAYYQGNELQSLDLKNHAFETYYEWQKHGTGKDVQRSPLPNLEKWQKFANSLWSRLAVVSDDIVVDTQEYKLLGIATEASDETQVSRLVFNDDKGTFKIVDWNEWLGAKPTIGTQVTLAKSLSTGKHMRVERVATSGKYLLDFDVLADLQRETKYLEDRRASK